MKRLLQDFFAHWKLMTSLFLGGFVAATLSFVVGASLLESTNTEEFCIGCHEMKSTTFAEFKGTIHDKNRSGVRATCPDCHVPHDFVAKMRAKWRALDDIYGHYISHSIDTPEKFEAERYRLATQVWKRMKSNDSQQCRNCHQDEGVNADLQTPKTKSRHAKGKAQGMTCIDCHFAIAHKEPNGPGPQELKISKAQ